MSELNKQEIRSPELQDVMSEIPGSFLRWGLFVFFGIIAIFIIGSYLIKNPEVVTVPVVITTQNPPVTLVARTGGEIEKLFVSEGIAVTKNMVISCITNSCNYEDFNTLNLFLAELDHNNDWTETVRTTQPPIALLLGELQPNYSQFQRNWFQLKDYIEQGYIPAKLKFLEEQLVKKLEINCELKRQQLFLIEDLALARSSFNRDSMLFRKDISSLSAKEYEKSRQGYIQKLYSYSVFVASLKNNEADSLHMREIRLDLQIQYKKEVLQFIILLEESLQLLKSSMAQWEERYLIKSPVNGIITLGQFRHVNQVIKAGEILATVIPETPADIVIKGIIPVSGFGNIEAGQKVNIKLSGFPYMQYGLLKGKVSSVSQVPGEKGFYADIELTEGMTSTYKERIRFIHQMDGTADIITKDTRLISKFLNPFRNAIQN
jgi:hypothetical protein